MLFIPHFSALFIPHFLPHLPSTHTLPERQPSQYDKILNQGNFKKSQFPNRLVNWGKFGSTA